MDLTRLLRRALNSSCVGCGNIRTSWWLCVLLLMAQLLDLCTGLRCWHCIADNCDINPEHNHRAEKRQCLDGQICQKVVFEMQSDVDESKYKSTVRSCSEDCIPQNDYINCTIDMYTTMGCVKRACCGDDDLCNTATPSVGYHGNLSDIFARPELLLSWNAVLCVISACLLSFW